MASVRSSDASVVGGDEADAVIAPTDPPYLLGDETCATTSIIPEGYPSNCRKTRSCQSCLQKAGCMIDQFGVCVDQFSARYSTSLNYSVAYSMNMVLPNATTTNPEAANRTQYWTFRAFEATYCPRSDPICQECINQHFWSLSLRPDSRFCEGRNGCICIFDCENRYQTSDVQCISPPLTPSSTTQSQSEGKNVASVVKVMVLGLCVILLLFATCLFRCIRKDYDQRQRQDRQRREAHITRATLREQQRQQRLEKLGVSALSLSGWQTFRQSLIDKENGRVIRSESTLIGTDSILSPSATPYVLSIDDDDAARTRQLASTPVLNDVRSTDSTVHPSVQ